MDQTKKGHPSGCPFFLIRQNRLFLVFFDEFFYLFRITIVKIGFDGKNDTAVFIIQFDDLHGDFHPVVEEIGWFFNIK